MKYCPFCEGQGEIYKAKIKGENLRIFICDECDTCWKDSGINKDNCYSFKSVMREVGRDPLWSELENIEKVRS